MENIKLILAASIIIEALVEYAKSIQTSLESDSKKQALTQIATIALGVLIAFAFNVRLLDASGIETKAVFDIALSGILISRGSNYVSDLLKKLNTL